ncbi:hypothetical protein [Largemouth bass virus]|uniref:Secreted protein n=1 Tax=Largemouth bass virus TaxID=176656 RepID=A0A9E7TJS7_9VIRU|nr:hypothetical protein [Largemouth bass virus]WAK75113.1 hypothetical protein [Mandarin fish ranavirus]WEI28986.1 hypothetical protein [Largemouth bass virus]WHA35553.1 hypothetical protein MSRaV_65R [Micropterus salmoides ranavirus]WHA35658.1 hypothetical protein SCRaV_65R [Siniperca chuatsi ranavirus]
MSGLQTLVCLLGAFYIVPVWCWNVNGLGMDTVYECTSCPEPTVTGAGNLPNEQRAAYLSGGGVGDVRQYSDQDWNLGFQNGFTVGYGDPCQDKCRPFSASVHYCKPQGKKEDLLMCANIGRDQYGRRCQTYEKTSGYKNYCYVVNANSYWPHNGGKWGYTHPFLCYQTKKSCRYGYLDGDGH